MWVKKKAGYVRVKPGDVSLGLNLAIRANGGFYVPGYSILDIEKYLL